eukprot:378579-Pelagomonas_calceolata.AAC.4
MMFKMLRSLCDCSERSHILCFSAMGKPCTRTSASVPCLVAAGSSRKGQGKTREGAGASQDKGVWVRSGSWQQEVDISHVLATLAFFMGHFPSYTFTLQTFHDSSNLLFPAV